MRFLVVFGSGTGTNTNGIWPSCAGSSAGGSITTSSVSSMVIGHPNATDQNRASARIGSTHDKMHETSAGWLAFLRGLVARGLAGTTLVISDAHVGLVDAVRSTLTGAVWQRCRTHFMRNLLTRVPKSAQAMVATLVRTIFAQPDAASVWEQHARVVDQLTEGFPAAAELLAEAAPDVLAFTGFLKEHWKQVWSNHPQERLNKELRRRTDVVGIFPDRDAVVRLVGPVLAEQHDEWAVVRRYMSAESLAKARLHIIDCDAEEVIDTALAEVS